MMPKRFHSILAGVIIAIIVVGVTAVELNKLPAPNRLVDSTSMSQPSSGIHSSATSSTINSEGIQLSLSINATELVEGQFLEANVSLFNTHLQLNTISTSDNWLFQGIPLAMWPDCFYTNAYVSNPSYVSTHPYAPENFTTAAEVVVLKGNFVMGNITNAADIYIPRVNCHEVQDVNQLSFGQNSSQASLMSGVTNGTSLGSYEIANSFSTGGYWDLLNNSLRVGGFNPLTNTSIQQPPFIDYGRQQSELTPTVTAFVAGVYTIAVADEWGQAVILHFNVRS